MTTQARELPPLYMVIDSDDTEYKYATIEDAQEALDLLLEIYNDEAATAFATLEDGEEDTEEDAYDTVNAPEPYMQKWNAITGEWEVFDW